MAAYLARRQGGQINILKLMKLMYMADRESISQHGAPISFDRFVSMDDGPVLSRTLNLINGTVPQRIAAAWDEWISDRANHQIACNREFERGDLDHLSDVDIDVLDSVWRDFGHMNEWELVEYTHQHFREWDDPHGSSLPIPELRILQALGVDNTEAERLAAAIRAEHEIDRTFAN